MRFECAWMWRFCSGFVRIWWIHWVCHCVTIGICKKYNMLSYFDRLIIQEFITMFVVNIQKKNEIFVQRISCKCVFTVTIKKSELASNSTKEKISSSCGKILTAFLYSDFLWWLQIKKRKQFLVKWYNFPKTHTGTNTTVEAAPTLQDRLSTLLKKTQTSTTNLKKI